MRAVLISAEPSGARLASALAEHLQDPVLLHREISAVGPVEALSLVGQARSWMGEVERRIAAVEAPIAVTVDAPTLHLRLAARLKRRGVRVVHWVSPQLWAWRRYRRHRIARSLDALGCLLPFEPGLYRDTPLRARFTGHPGAAAPLSPRPAAIGVAAGSRLAERERLGSVFEAAAVALGLPIVEAVPSGCAPCCAEAERVDDVRALAQRVQFAFVCSGTATLELAAAGVPMVSAYAMHPASWAIAQRLVGLETAALPNLVLGRRLVPEVFQQVATAGLVRLAEPLMGEEGDRCSRALREVGPLLCGEQAASRMAGLVEEVALTN